MRPMNVNICATLMDIVIFQWIRENVDQQVALEKMPGIT